MSKFMKKPVVIEAIIFKDDAEVLLEIQNFMGKELVIDYSNPKEPKLQVGTLKGVAEASLGDYIIKGDNGEFYPCKPDVFEKDYEEIEI